MPKILIVFAQTREASATLKRLKATPVPLHTIHVWTEGVMPSYYQFDQGFIVISNTGIHAAQMAVSKYAHAFDEIWNWGVAGSLKDNQPIGKIYAIEKVDKYVPVQYIPLDEGSKECIASTLSSHNLNSLGHKLISSDFPIHDKILRESLSSQWDLVDMEGYGIAFAAHHLGKTCKIWKVISDFASENGREFIHRHMEELSEIIADKIDSEL
ncbi:MAG: hypothetical protein S4CHLAM123_02520 [Chlamydiales bacterium]|nr:hypothetical protein [Chlamydiales bacterium]